MLQGVFFNFFFVVRFFVLLHEPRMRPGASTRLHATLLLLHSL